MIQNLTILVPFVIAAGVVLLLIFFITTRNRKFRQDVLKYFYGHAHPKVLAQIKNKSKHIKLKGQEKVITVLFVDLRGFTSLSERYSNRKVVRMLNEYLNIVTDKILDNYGLVDKYLGDGVMAFWGAPLYDRYQATHALKAAYAIQKHFENEDVYVGIGINTGPAIVGNIGREEMIGYTAIGNTVNISSRIEGLNKHYGTEILVTKSTVEKFQSEPKTKKPEVYFREVDKVKVYGKNNSTIIHELVSINENLETKHKEGYEWFELGLSMYRKGNWDKAENMFRTANKRLGTDSVSKTFIRRCQKFAISPPAGRWDGTISLGK
jgi:adenylate cyclase